jgi:hypothetical protein
MKQAGWIRLGLIVVVLATLAAVLAPSAAGGDPRLVARVEEPFAVNGQIFPPGEIAIRHVSRYSPTATLNQIWVDGELLGLFLAKVLPGDPANTEHSLHFDRDSESRLVLAGFAPSGEPVRAFYRFRTVTSGDRWTSRGSRDGDSAQPLVASR